MEYRPERPDERSEEDIRAATRRQIGLEIILPLVVLLVAMIALVVMLWTGGVASAGTWADVALVILLVPMMVIGLIVLALLLALLVGVIRFADFLPGPSRRGRELMAGAARSMQQGTDFIVRPFLVVESLARALVRLVEAMRSVYRRK